MAGMSILVDPTGANVALAKQSQLKFVDDRQRAIYL